MPGTGKALLKVDKDATISRSKGFARIIEFSHRTISAATVPISRTAAMLANCCVLWTRDDAE